MTFSGARDHDAPKTRCDGIERMDRLARMAEADNWLHEPKPIRRRGPALWLRALWALSLAVAVLAVVYGALVAL